ncbi:MAG: hypothetical protein J6V72_05215 [Kiritimatiellae bacterium]|nr:hypothetical protein [Kiritimatiellia bacterium]
MNYVLTPTAVRKLRRVLAPTPGNTGAGGAPTTIHPDDFPPPFTVRWSRSQSEGQGAWVIWLPDTSQLVMYDKAYLTPSGITAASALPSGWYKISDLQTDAEEVWLVVHVPEDPESTTPPSAELSGTEGQATTGESVINLLVAQMETDETSGTTGARRVKQFVDSAVVFGGGASVTPDDVSIEFTPNDPAQGADNTHEGELQIKGWNKGTPHPQSSIADDLQASGTLGGHVVFRESDGSLSYKSIGHLPTPTTVNDGVLTIIYGTATTFSANQSGNASITISKGDTRTSVSVLTGVSWDSTNHRLVINSAHFDLENGVIKNWTPDQPQPIPTTAISSILPQQGGGE